MTGQPFTQADVVRSLSRCPVFNSCNRLLCPLDLDLEKRDDDGRICPYVGRAVRGQADTIPTAIRAAVLDARPRYEARIGPRRVKQAAIPRLAGTWAVTAADNSQATGSGPPDGPAIDGSGTVVERA